jgi:hypothetical protein
LQVFDVGAEAVVDLAGDEVVAAGRGGVAFADDVAKLVDDVVVVAVAADQAVGAAAAVERVVSEPAVENVGAGVAGEGVVEAAAERFSMLLRVSVPALTCSARRRASPG